MNNFASGYGINIGISLRISFFLAQWNIAFIILMFRLSLLTEPYVLQVSFIIL